MLNIIALIVMHFNKLFRLTNSFILTISGRDIARPLGIYFRLFANNIHDIKYHNQCSDP